MKPVFITATDISDLWFQLLRKTVAIGREYEVTKGSTPSKRWELDFMSARITHPWTRPLTPKMPSHVNIPDPVEPGYEDEYLRYYLTDHKEEGEHYTYGEFMHWQIEFLNNYYRKHGHGTKHGYIQVGLPDHLLTYKNEEGTTPCLRGVDTAIKYGRLHFSIHFRSWNLWSGLPANLACLQLVKEYMADCIGVGDGEMYITCLKLGLQESVFEYAQQRVNYWRT